MGDALAPLGYAAACAMRPSIELIPYADDPLQVLAQRLLSAAVASGLDLRRAVVLFPHGAAIPRFRRTLLAHACARGQPALLAPYCATLPRWIAGFADPSRPRLSEAGRELLLLEALADHPRLAERFGTWPLVDSLLELFDELSLHRIELSPQLPALTSALIEGYGVSGAIPAPLSDEAQLAHSLWHAWRRQLAHEGVQDAVGAYLSGLERSLQTLEADVQLYLAGFVRFTRTELDWIRTLTARGQLTLLLHGRSGDQGYHPEAVITQIVHALGAPVPAADLTAPYSDFLDQAYRPAAGDLATRARAQTDRFPASPACGRLVLHEAANFEQEARAIDVQVRRWLLQGRRHIGVITNDRKLARRVRALLERAEVSLQDAAGWALSTTSAATALMRWIECLERDFAHEPLLDLLKSPFVPLGLSPDERRERVMGLEQALVRGHNVARGLERYRRALERAQAPEPVCELLARLAQARAPLAPLIGGSRREASELLAALLTSLEVLGMRHAYEADEAGIQVLALLQETATAFGARRLHASWTELREWLRRSLERRRFQPRVRAGGVQLMDFEQSRLARFDAVVIGGAMREHLPGPAAGGALFNDAARRQLGLPPRSWRRCALFHDFRRLLEAAPLVLVTLRQEQDGEAAAPSPWVERLRAFHQVAYGDALDDRQLGALARSPATEVTVQDSGPLPRPRPHPVATLPAARVPDSISASAHQSLLDCPYQYYAAYGLRLAPAEEVHERIEKRDYGERVHRILQAFHGGVPGLPGPFGERLTHETQARARVLLDAVADAAFAPDVERSPLARGWRLRWQAIVDAYLDWELQRQRAWTPAEVELRCRARCGEGDAALTLSARIDRLDRGARGAAILDYKTGHVPDASALAAGEQIQLPFYRLALAEALAEARYVQLEGPKVIDTVALEGDTLQALADKVRARLLQVQRALRRGSGLPAWGDDRTCELCPMQGLCRREMWHESPPPA